MNTEDNNSVEVTNGGDSLYGAGAVTGSAEDALKGRDVEIKSTATETVSLKEDEVKEDAPEETQNKDSEEEKTPEEQKDSTKDDSGDKEDTPESRATEYSEAAKADKDLQDDLASKGVDFDAMADEYMDKGELSKESYEKLQKAGYPQSVVDAYIKGLEATAEKFANDVMDYVGGQQEYLKLAKFIQQQGDGSAERFNDLIEAGDINNIKLALDGFRARMYAQKGKTGRSILGSSNANVSRNNIGYSSRAEMVKAMSDKRYGVDRAYTEEVQRKTMNSPFIG
jgi:hypothetical protein